MTSNSANKLTRFATLLFVILIFAGCASEWADTLTMINKANAERLQQD